jgi:hypothetical protein
MASLNHQVPGELVARIDCALPGARSFQKIPIRMKNPISIRKVVDMMATIRNTSPVGSRVIARLIACRAPLVKFTCAKIVSVPKVRGDAIGAGLSDLQFLNHQSRNLCGVFDTGLRDLDYLLRDHFR